MPSSPAQQPQPKSWFIALMLSVFFGYLGIDRFYMGYAASGILKLITAGGLGLWWIIDAVRIFFNEFPDVNGMKLQK